MFFQFRYVFVVIFITSSFAARDVSMKFPPVTFVDEEEHKDRDNNQCEHDHVIEELDGLHASIKPLIDKTEMIGKHMRGFKGPKDKREWELEPSFEDFYYADKRGLRKFLGAKGKKSYHEDFEDEEENRLDNEIVRNPRYYYLNYPLGASKRGRSMFQGNRGKKGYASNDWEKKAALNFQPFRGKRSLMDKLRELAKHDSYDSQGEKELEEFVQGPYGYLLTNFYNKREPVAYRRSYGKIFADKRLRKGYTGLRGKRNIIGAYEGGAELDQQVIDRNVVKDSGELFPFKKRTPYFFSGTHTKFVGARGKKWKPVSCEGTFY